MKSLLDVADNLERAAGLEQTDNAQQPSAEQASKQYRSLMEGVKLTQKILEQVGLVTLNSVYYAHGYHMFCYLSLYCGRW